MVEESTQEWFLEIEGSKAGPFPTEQILGLLADKEIPETARIQSSAPGSAWITVRELAASQQQPSRNPPAQPAKPFVPPPRPAVLQPSNEFTHPGTEPTVIEIPAAPKHQPAKPEFSLFDALIAAKERKAQARGLPPQMKVARPNPFRLPAIPRKLWMVAGTATVLCVAAWGMVHVIKQKTSSLAANLENGSATPPAQVQPLNTAQPPSRPTITGSVAAYGLQNMAPAGNPPPHPAAMMPPALGQNNPSDEEREREREHERIEHERERDIANVDTAAQPMTPSAAPQTSNEGGVPVPPPPLRCPSQRFRSQRPKPRRPKRPIRPPRLLRPSPLPNDAAAGLT